jgi:hypothetical protein
MRSVLLAPAIAIAVSGIRPVYSVSHVPGLYQHPHPAFFQLLLKTKAEPSIDPWVALAPRLGGPRVTLG